MEITHPFCFKKPNAIIIAVCQKVINHELEVRQMPFYATLRDMIVALVRLNRFMPALQSYSDTLSQSVKDLIIDQIHTIFSQMSPSAPPIAATNASPFYKVQHLSHTQFNVLMSSLYEAMISKFLRAHVIREAITSATRESQTRDVENFMATIMESLFDACFGRCSQLLAERFVIFFL